MAAAGGGGGGAFEACAAGCGKRASACHRAAWPTVPQPPIFRSGDDLRAWRRLYEEDKARRLAAPRVPVCQARRTCLACAGQPFCACCKAWECAACAADGATAAAFSEDHKTDPAGEEDEYGRRGEPPFRALDLQACTTCRARRVCVGCRRSCGHCAGAVCPSCPFRSTGCDDCEAIIDNNDDYDIGPVDRDAGICAACWAAGEAAGGVRCDCGEPARGSEAAEDEGGEYDDDFEGF